MATDTCNPDMHVLQPTALIVYVVKSLQDDPPASAHGGVSQSGLGGPGQLHLPSKSDLPVSSTSAETGHKIERASWSSTSAETVLQITGNVVRSSMQGSILGLCKSCRMLGPGLTAWVPNSMEENNLPVQRGRSTLRGPCWDQNQAFLGHTTCWASARRPGARTRVPCLPQEAKSHSADTSFGQKVTPSPN
jgi:hypothetical protein